MTMTTSASRRVAIYERVSSDDQRERETIKTQSTVLDARVAAEPDVEVVARYSDDGVSGTRRLRDRAGGARLLDDAAAGRFDELWIYRIDRLGRNLADMAEIGGRLEHLGVRIVSVTEGTPDPFMYDILSALAQNELRTLRRRLGDGANRAAQEGRYPGGVVPYGYRVDGERKSGRQVPDESPISGELTAAGLIRQIYHWIGIEGWSCVRVAEELNLRGVPTYAASGRGRRRLSTQAAWRHGRIRNMVVNPIYKGVQVFGRRNGTKADRPRRPRPLISASIEPLVSTELWQAAQETLARNRTIARNTVRRYVLQGVIRCGSCGLAFVGCQGRPGVHWYRCGGKTPARGPFEGRCRAPLLRGDAIEPAILAEIERWLRDPGDVLAEIDADAERAGQRATREADAALFARRLEGLEAQRKKALELSIRGHLADAELEAELGRIAAERAGVERRLAEADVVGPEAGPTIDVDLLTELRARVEAGLTDEQWQAIVRLLVRVVVHHEVDERGERRIRASIEYRFPQGDLGVLQTRTNMGSSPQRAGTGRGTRSHGQLA